MLSQQPGAARASEAAGADLIRFTLGHFGARACQKSTHAAPRNGGASVSGTNRGHEASEALSSSFALWHHDQMQANAVSQRAAWVLVPRPLNCRLSDAVSMGGGRKNAGASVSGAYWVHEAPQTLSSCLALRHHDQMQANAVWQRAAWVLVPRSLIYSASNAYRWAAGAENPAHLFPGQLWCLQRMGH